MPTHIEFLEMQYYSTLQKQKNKFYYCNDFPSGSPVLNISPTCFFGCLSGIVAHYASIYREIECRHGKRIALRTGRPK